MSQRRNYKNKRKGNNRSKRKYTEIEKFAYRLGQVTRGRSNPDSRISESFEAGAKKRERKPRKTLY